MSADRDRTIAICFWNADLACGQSSRRFAVVVAQQPAQALAAHYWTGRPPGLLAWLNQPVANSLMTSLGMKMFHERICGRFGDRGGNRIASAWLSCGIVFSWHRFGDSAAHVECGASEAQHRFS
jgi:hypothetical protein